MGIVLYTAYVHMVLCAHMFRRICVDSSLESSCVLFPRQEVSIERESGWRVLMHMQLELRKAARAAGFTDAER